MIIDKYVDRVASGSKIRNIRALKDGVFEMKIYHGSGLRVYFTEEDKTILLLLLGGDKGSQKRDIAQAKKYWRNHAKKK